jgi:hypothetical protein
MAPKKQRTAQDGWPQIRVPAAVFDRIFRLAGDMQSATGRKVPAWRVIEPALDALDAQETTAAAQRD